MFTDARLNELVQGKVQPLDLSNYIIVFIH